MSTQWYVEGWYPDFCILSELLPAPHPNSWSSKMQILLVHISSELFSSSAVEKIYFCLWVNWVWSDLFAARAQGCVTPPDLWRSAHSLSPEASPAGQGKQQQLLSAEWQHCWDCKSSSCRNIIFTTLIIFSVSLDTDVLSHLLMFWARAAWLGSCSGLTGRGSELAAQRDPQNQCL